jgi:predicted acylesterase/phospholipase RssA
MKYLAIGPGAMGMFSLAGSIYWLEDQLEEIEEISGSSAGSIIGLFLSLNKKPQDIIDFLFNVDFLTYYKFKLKNFVSKFGLIEASNAKQLFIDFLGRDPKFKDLKKKLYISVYNVNFHKTQYFSIDTHPNMSAIDAMFMSISIPLLFTSSKLDDSIYIDGGIFEKIPMSPFLNKKREDVLGIEIDFLCTNKSQINSFKDFMQFLYSKCMRSCSVEYDKKVFNIITLKQNENISIFDFKMHQNDKWKLFYEGYADAYRHSGFTK